ncbi:hypothetical protein K505DRAFT_327246 [Melanomma pulvis-pyrius CBS 109.77]|uniref:Uncharacterized protein n=1 Tax=Melanomma pulvis-pyrius CBS 109.77 TaxID=1314802 RepID=A0A6A6X467_9PLEO|nr:hypothetical protein K505DRAFT_327246 [Melanomma pulvis-pyrius CBS 109.77]
MSRNPSNLRRDQLLHLGTHVQPDSNADRLKLVKSYAANYCDPSKSAAAWMPDDTWFRRMFSGCGQIQPSGTTMEGGSR